MKWEYHIEDVRPWHEHETPSQDGYTGDLSESKQRLNELGAEGWELAHVSEEFCIFKRLER